MPKRIVFAYLALIIALSGIANAEPTLTDIKIGTVEFTAAEIKRILSLSPLPPLPKDISNAVADSDPAAKFGRKLFFDKRFSANGDMSCASCHDPKLGWADGKRVSTEKILFPRNTPSLWNTAYNRWYFWDGRADSAWSQATGPIENKNEMNFNRMELIHLIRNDEQLQKDYKAIFGSLYSQFSNSKRFPLAARPDYSDYKAPLNKAWMSMTKDDRDKVNRVFSNIAKAIAAFERTLITPASPFDYFVEILRSGQIAIIKNQNNLNNSELRGLKFFVSKGKCTFCHSGPNFTDGEFHDLGIAVGHKSHLDPGRYAAVRTLLNDPFNRIGAYADQIDSYAPVNYINQQGHQLAQFKTPTLRQLTHTAPYMHDGRFKSLREVIEFYSTLKNARPLEHASNLVQALNLDEQGINDLLSFLESLSSPTEL